MYFNLWLKTRKSILSKHEAEHFQTFQGALIWSETFPWALDLRSQTNTSSCVLFRDSNQQWFLIIQNIPQQWFSYLSFMNYQWVWGVSGQKNRNTSHSRNWDFWGGQNSKIFMQVIFLVVSMTSYPKTKQTHTNLKAYFFFQNLTSMIIQNQQFRHK